MPTFTAYMFGTGEKFQMNPDKRNILTTFANFTDPHPLVKDKVEYNPETRHASLALDGASTFGTEVSPNAQTAAKAVFAWLIQELLHPHDPDEKININFAGFSRGSVTALEALNILNQMLDKHIFDVHENKRKIFQENLSKLHILLYANDPVSGFSDKTLKSRIVIPEIKINYKLDAHQEEMSHAVPLDHIAPIQQDEMRREFKPQDISRREVEDFETVNSIYLPFYGNHSDSMKYKGDNIADCAIINYNLMYQALSSHGTQFTKHNIIRTTPAVDPKTQKIKYTLSEAEATTDIPPMYGHVSTKISKTLADAHKNGGLTLDEDMALKGGQSRPSGYGSIYFDKLNTEQLLEHFARAKFHREDYEKSGKKMKFFDSFPLIAKAQRSFTQQLEYYVDESDFFLNQYERELLKQAYPAAFNFLFERGLKDDYTERNPEEMQTLRNNFHEDLNKMGKQNPNVLRVLRSWISSTITLEEGAVIRLNELTTPLGNYKLETSPLTSAIKGQKYKPQNFFAHQLELLEKEVVQETMRYQRTKEEYMAFYEKAHFNEATQIRETVKLITYGKGDKTRLLSPKEKYQKALQYLNKEFKRLHSVGSESDLKDRLEKILRHHGYNYEIAEDTSFFKGIGAGFGHTINLGGKFFNVIGNTFATLFGFLGTPIEDIGRRLSDFNVPFVGDVLEAIGFGVRKGFGIPFIFNAIGFGIQKAGNSVINLSGYYHHKTTETYTERLEPPHTLEDLGVNKEAALKVLDEHRQVQGVQEHSDMDEEVMQKTRPQASRGASDVLTRRKSMNDIVGNKSNDSEEEGEGEGEPRKPSNTI